jgi:hypothetical protein
VTHSLEADMCLLDRALLAEAQLTRLEAASLAEVRRRSWHEALGFARLGDFCREALGIAPRSGYELLDLDRLLTAWPALEAAFAGGALTACQVRALGPICRRAARLEGDAGPALVAAWVAIARGLPVRELVTLVRAAIAEMDGPGASPDASDESPLDEDAETISFDAPPIVRVLVDQAFELASRLLGRRAARWECLEAVLIEAAPEQAAAGVEETAARAADVRTRVAPEGDGGAELEAGPAARLANVRTRVAPEGDGGVGLEAGPAARAADVRTRVAPEGDGGAELEAGPAARLANVRTRRAAERLAPATLAAANVRTRAAAVRLAQSRDRLEEALDDLDDLLDTAPVALAEDMLARLQSLRALRRPLRALTSRFLRHLREAGVLDGLAGGRLDALLEERFGLAPRTARHRVAEARLFEDRPDLEEAWAHGRLGLLQAVAIHRMAPHGRAEAWIARAEQVTVRQFEREVAFQERLRLFAAGTAHRHPGPFPDAALEGELRAALVSRGIPAVAGAERRAADSECAGTSGCAGTPGCTSTPGSAGAPVATTPADPAEDPSLMRRLEALLDALISAGEDSAATSLAALSAGAAGPGPGLSDNLGSRPTFAHDPWRPRHTRISITAPRLVAAHWYAAMAAISREFDDSPTWLSMTVLCARAVHTWSQVDPDTRPTEWRTLDRDEYTCQAPGCSARKTLEVHHIIPRAQRGPTAPWNVVTLCHAHHHHGVHRGHLRVSGRAPGALRWGLGRRRNGRPIGQFLGERRVM